jgi:glycine cleavage system H protein
MSADLVFMMGNFEASFPTDRLYAKNHMWALPSGGSPEPCFRLGLTAYAVRLLQDVYFLDLTIEPGMTLKSKQEIGSIESKKAESSLYTPAAGEVTGINHDLIDDPTAINLDKYGAGWMYELTTRGDDFLQPQQYIEHLQAAWEVAQRTIKGQVNA